MKRLLCIMSGMNVGGAETFIMKIYRIIDKEKFQFDFCVNMPIEENYYSKEIQNYGGKIYVLPPKKEGPLRQFLAIKKVVKDNRYDYILKVKQHSLACLDLLAAKLGGAHNLILRSSNAATSSMIYEFLHKLFAFLPKKIPTVKIAPSIEAAEYTFGKKQVSENMVHILNNGVDTPKFTYDKVSAEAFRAEYGIDQEKLVIGHIGRFSPQKNHDFLIDVFSEIVKKNNNAILVLVGVGELQNNIKRKVETMGLNEKVLFTGLRDDIPRMLSACDIIVFPSLYEGMPNTIIEAETNGLPCLVSDTVTRQAAITDLVRYKSLSDSASSWANATIQLYCEMKDRNRSSYGEIVKSQGYDISQTADEFIELVFGEEENEE